MSIVAPNLHQMTLDSEKPVDSVLSKDWEELHFARLENIELSQTNNKASLISQAIGNKDVESLALLSISSRGLLSVQLRCDGWPLLLCYTTDPQTDESLLNTLEINDCAPHKDEDQVLLDIKRLFTFSSHLHSFSHDMNSSYTTILSPEDVEALRKRLYCLIVKVLRKYPCLNYYQGFHDIASVALIVHNDLNDHDERAFKLLENLALYHLRDFMNPHIGLSINHLKLVPLILESVDPTIFQLIRQTSSSFTSTYGTFYDYKFYPALLATLTMYSHDISNLNHVMIIWDFIFGYGSISTLAYVYVSTIIHYKPKIVEELDVGDLSELDSVDPDLVHKIFSPAFLLSALSDADLANILTGAAALIEKWPLENLFASNEASYSWFKEFNTDSVVETSSKLRASTNEQHSTHKAFSSVDLQSLIELQEEQQAQESMHESQLFAKAMEQESLTSSINSLDEDSVASLSLSLLTSSLSNLTAVSSSINIRLSYTSSIILKKLNLHGEETKDDKRIRKDHLTSLKPYIYKLSVTIGIIGFLLHFLLKHSDVSHGYSSKVYYSLVRRVGFLIPEGSWNNSIFSHASKAMGDVLTSVQNTELGRIGRYFSEVGLGSVRKSVFAFDKIV